MHYLGDGEWDDSSALIDDLSTLSAPAARQSSASTILAPSVSASATSLLSPRVWLALAALAAGFYYLKKGK